VEPQNIEGRCSRHPIRDFEIQEIPGLLPKSGLVISEEINGNPDHGGDRWVFSAKNNTVIFGGKWYDFKKL
jgi:hypothetical protein